MNLKSPVTVGYLPTVDSIKAQLLTLSQRNRFCIKDSKDTGIRLTPTLSWRSLHSICKYIKGFHLVSLYFEISFVYYSTPASSFSLFDLVCVIQNFQICKNQLLLFLHTVPLVQLSSDTHARLKSKVVWLSLLPIIIIIIIIMIIIIIIIIIIPFI